MSRTVRRKAYRFVRLLPNRTSSGSGWDKWVGDRYGNTKLRRTMSKLRRRADKQEIQSALEDIQGV